MQVELEVIGMLYSEVIGITQDIEDTLEYLGTNETKTSAKYLRYNPTEYDTVYEENVSKEFVEYDINTIIYSNVANQELSNLGIDDKEVYKMLLTLKAYQDVNDGFLEPRIEDRVIYNGVTFDIIKFKKVLLGGENIIFFLFLKESDFTSQTEKTREKKDVYFEPDNSQREDETNTSKVLDDKYEDTPAILKGDYYEPFNIYTENKELKFNIEGEVYSVILNEGNDLTASQINTDIITQINNIKPSLVELCSQYNGYVCFKTRNKGENIIIEVLETLNNAYNTLGIKIEKFVGKSSLILKDNPDYDSEGNPV